MDVAQNALLIDEHEWTPSGCSIIPFCARHAGIDLQSLLSDPYSTTGKTMIP